MSARAGIVVTGTEVLTGRVQDRNGPWIADRLLELGVELAHITICGDRPGDIAAAAALPGRRGCGPDRHQRRTRADGRRHDGRSRRAVLWARTGVGRRTRGEDRGDPQAAAGTVHRGGLRCGAGRQPQAGHGARRCTDHRSGGHGTRRRRPRQADGRRAAGAAARAAADVAHRGGKPLCRRRSPAGRTTGRRRCGCSGFPSRGLPSRCARRRGTRRVRAA